MWCVSDVLCIYSQSMQCNNQVQHVIRNMINARKLKSAETPMMDSCASLRKTIPSSESTNPSIPSMYSLGGCRYKLKSSMNK